MIKIYEKIDQELKTKNWTLPYLHKRITEIFKEDAINSRTLDRTVKGETQLRLNSLFQIAAAFGMSPDEFRKGTDEDTGIIIYEYNKEAYLEIVADDLKIKEFLPAKLVMFPRAPISLEQFNMVGLNGSALFKKMLKLDWIRIINNKKKDKKDKGRLLIDVENIKPLLAKEFNADADRIYSILEETAYNPKTEALQDPIGEGRILKWIYCIKGVLNCYVQEAGVFKKQTIHEGETFSFESTAFHYYENPGVEINQSTVVQSPPNLY